MQLCSKTLMALEDAGITLSASVRTPYGSETITIDAKDAERFLADRDGYAAARYGIPREDYIAWVESEGTPRCGEITSKGTRCRNFVSGGIHLPLKVWMKLDGGQCAVHGGEESDEARMRIRCRKKGR